MIFTYKEKIYVVLIVILIEVAELISRKGANLKRLKEAWLAQFERDLTSERTKEGIMAVKKCEKYTGRLKNDKEKINEALYLIKQGMNRTDAAEKAGGFFETDAIQLLTITK